MGRRPGEALKRAVLADFALDMRELALLDSAARTADLVAALQAAVDESGAMVDGKPNPVLVELRLQRLTLGRLLAQLRFPDEDDGDTGQRRPVRGFYSGPRAVES